jgi:hypothetical protein
MSYNVLADELVRHVKAARNNQHNKLLAVE